MTTDLVDVKAALTEGLTELHLPTVKRTYEEAARLAERETLSYERYLLDLVMRETQDRRQKRIQRLLRQSRIPAEKALANFNLKRVALLTKSLIEGEVLDRRDNVPAFGNPGSGKTHLLFTPPLTAANGASNILRLESVFSRKGGPLWGEAARTADADSTLRLISAP